MCKNWLVCLLVAVPLHGFGQVFDSLGTYGQGGYASGLPLSIHYSSIFEMHHDSVHLSVNDREGHMMDTIPYFELQFVQSICDPIRNTIKLPRNQSGLNYNFSKDASRKIDGAAPAVSLGYADDNETLEEIVDLFKDATVSMPNPSIPSGRRLAEMTGGTLINFIDIDDKLGIEEVHDQVIRYQTDLAGIRDEHLLKIEALPETIESSVEALDEMQPIAEASLEFEAIKAKWNDPEVMKEQALNQAKEVAVNHFSGKEEQLKAAMEKLARAKSKIPDVEGVVDMFVRKPRVMQDKTLKERLVPGLALQFQKKEAYWLDVNPYVGFKLTRRWLVGLGWNERFAYNFDEYTWDKEERIFGIRGYLQFRLKDKLWLKADAERMNAPVKSRAAQPVESPDRDWVWSYFAGVKKDIQVSELLGLSVQTLYNVYDLNRRSPYVHRLNVRVGVEFNIKSSRQRRVSVLPRR